MDNYRKFITERESNGVAWITVDEAWGIVEMFAKNPLTTKPSKMEKLLALKGSEKGEYELRTHIHRDVGHDIKIKINSKGSVLSPKVLRKSFNLQDAPTILGPLDPRGTRQPEPPCNGMTGAEIEEVAPMREDLEQCYKRHSEPKYRQFLVTFHVPHSVDYMHRSLDPGLNVMPIDDQSYVTISPLGDHHDAVESGHDETVDQCPKCNRMKWKAMTLCTVCQAEPGHKMTIRFKYDKDVTSTLPEEWSAETNACPVCGACKWKTDAVCLGCREYGSQEGDS